MINNIPEIKQMNKYNIDFFYMYLFTMRCQCVLNRSSIRTLIILVQDKKYMI